MAVSVVRSHQCACASFDVGKGTDALGTETTSNNFRPCGVSATAVQNNGDHHRSLGNSRSMAVTPRSIHVTRGMSSE